MTENLKIIEELESALEWVDKDDNLNGSVAIKIWCVREMLKTIKEQIPNKCLVHNREIRE